MSTKRKKKRTIPTKNTSFVGTRNPLIEKIKGLSHLTVEDILLSLYIKFPPLLQEVNEPYLKDVEELELVNHECFENAHKLVEKYPNLTYCEGLVVDLTVLPENVGIHHGWCCDENGDVVDPFTVHFNNNEVPRFMSYVYFGVKLPKELNDNCNNFSQRVRIMVGQYNISPKYNLQECLPDLVTSVLILDHLKRKRSRQLNKVVREEREYTEKYFNH